MLVCLLLQQFAFCSPVIESEELEEEEDDDEEDVAEEDDDDDDDDDSEDDEASQASCLLTRQMESELNVNFLMSD